MGIKHRAESREASNLQPTASNREAPDLLSILSPISYLLSPGFWFLEHRA